MTFAHLPIDRTLWRPLSASQMTYVWNLICTALIVGPSLNAKIEFRKNSFSTFSGAREKERQCDQKLEKVAQIFDEHCQKVGRVVF